MAHHTILPDRKRIALVAHDAQKPNLLEWVKFNQETLGRHLLFATGSTGALLARETGLPVYSVKSGPLGGDQQIGAKIVEGEIEFLIFFGIHSSLNLTTRM